MDNQENRIVNNLREHPKESLASLGKEGLDKRQAITEKWGSVQGEMETQQLETSKFKFESVPKAILNECQVGLDSTKGGEGLMAMTYKMELGWVAERMGLKSGHWKKKKARASLDKRKRKRDNPNSEEKGWLNTTHGVRSEHASG